MASLKEIVTKAVIGKGKNSNKDVYDIVMDTDIDNVLGCWIINHKFQGSIDGDVVKVDGSYDINVWYSYDNNTKTNVIVRSFNYIDKVKVNLQKDEVLTDSKEIIVRCLSNPQVSDVKVDKHNIKLEVEKELSVEVVGDMLVRISALDNDEYDEKVNVDDLDMNIDENYLNK